MGLYVDDLCRVEMKDAGAERNMMKYEYQWCAGECLITGFQSNTALTMCASSHMNYLFVAYFSYKRDVTECGVGGEVLELTIVQYFHCLIDNRRKQPQEHRYRMTDTSRQ